MVATLATLTVSFALIATTSGAPWAYLIAGSSLVALIVFGMVRFRLRTLAAQREMTSAFGWEPWADVKAATPEPVRLPPLLDRWAFTRVVWGGLAGCALDAVAAGTDRLIGRRTTAAPPVGGTEPATEAYLGRQSRWALTAGRGRHRQRHGCRAPRGKCVSRIGRDLTVKSGDTLARIAANVPHTTTATLAETNHIADPDRIVVGQVLSLSPPSTAPPAPTATATTAEVTYVVKPGDTLGAIASKYHTTVPSLATSNKIANPNVIKPGEMLVVGARPHRWSPPRAPRAPRPWAKPTRSGRVTRWARSLPATTPRPQRWRRPTTSTIRTGSSRAKAQSSAEVARLPFGARKAGPHGDKAGQPEVGESQASHAQASHAQASHARPTTAPGGRPVPAAIPMGTGGLPLRPDT